MENKQKLFAFKVVANKQNNEVAQKDGKWTARDGVAAAGCTDYRFPGNVRYGKALRVMTAVSTANHASR